MGICVRYLGMGPERAVSRVEEHVHLPYGLVESVEFVDAEKGSQFCADLSHVDGRLGEDAVADDAGGPVPFASSARPRLS